MKLKDRKTLILIILIILPIFVWSIFLVTSKKGNPNASVREGEKINETVYPEYVGDPEINPNIDARAAFSVYYDGKEEKILYKKNAKEFFPIASISKLMTALVVFENYDLEEQLGVTEKEVFSRTEFRDFRAWSETKIEEIIHPMLIESNNSAAFSLALVADRFLPSDEEPVKKFVNYMNERAKDIGMENTRFINPSGLDGIGEYNGSTAEDIVLFSRYILEKRPEIFEISNTPLYRLYSPDKLVYYEIVSTNDFLFQEKWHGKIIGGKTGETPSSIGCLLLITNAPCRDFSGKCYTINVILGSPDRFGEMEKLINLNEKNYAW